MENNNFGSLNKFYFLVNKAIQEDCDRERDSHPSSFGSFYAQQKQKGNEVASAYIKECSQAFRIIMQDLSFHHDEQAIRQLVEGAERFLITIDEPKNENAVLNDYFGYSQEIFETVYQVGLRCLENGKLEDAEKIFNLLILLDPGYSACWVMLGIVYKKEKQWEKGIDSFEVAMEIDKHNPVAYVHAASCYRELGRKKEARDALNTALKEIVGHPEYVGIEKMARFEQNHL